MKKKEPKKKEPEKKPQVKKPKKRKFLFLILIFILSAAVAGALTWYLYLGKDKFRTKSYTFFDFPAKTQSFFNKNYPNIISLADSVQNELQNVEKESQRILNLEKEYPDQKNITQKALQQLEKIENESKNEMNEIIRNLNNIYVRANLGSEEFETNFAQDAKKAEEKLQKLKNKITGQSKPYKTNKKTSDGIIEKVKNFVNPD
jgi:ABC-type transporter Mla subunit MlaD